MTVGDSRWTPELVDRLLAAVAHMFQTPDMRLVDVAAELGVSRNMLIGKIERLRRKGYDIPDMSDRQARNMPRRRREQKPPRTVTIRLPPVPEVLVQISPRPRVLEEPPPGPPPEVGRYAPLELERCHCHWPFGDRPPFTFCGAKAEPGQPYCTAHCRVAYNRRA